MYNYRNQHNFANHSHLMFYIHLGEEHWIGLENLHTMTKIKKYRCAILNNANQRTSLEIKSKCPVTVGAT
jgi:hypothetical protein